jgi:hypothetical protein
MRTFSMQGTLSEYDAVLARVNTGASLTEAQEHLNVSRTHFTRKRCIAEAAKVNMPELQNAMVNLRKVTLVTLYPVAKDICNRHLGALRLLHAQGGVLLPKERY